MNRANVLIQIFAQIAVWVVDVFISLLHRVLELETVVVRRSGCGVVHAGKLVAAKREGQVARGVVQVLGELAPADARQPTAQRL